MAKRKQVRVEDLAFPQLLQVIGEAEGRMSAHEAETAQALHPVLRLLLDKRTGPAVMVGTLARTAILFVVDHDEFQAACNSGASPTTELPPLPYSRIAVECQEDATWAVGYSDGSHDYDLELFTINEEEPGKVWSVCLLLRVAGTYDAPMQAVQMFTVYAGGRVEFLNVRQRRDLPDLSQAENQNELRSLLDQMRPNAFEWDERVYEPDDPVAIGARAIPIEFAHLVNARGVTVDPVAIPRPQRRRFSRSRATHPQVYFVYIGDGTSDAGGVSDREYHCRWLVRGHWRHYADGERTWVRPYIKGPAGAPWRGRPIYVVTEEEAALTA